MGWGGSLLGEGERGQKHGPCPGPGRKSRGAPRFGALKGGKRGNPKRGGKGIKAPNLIWKKGKNLFLDLRGEETRGFFWGRGGAGGRRKRPGWGGAPRCPLFQADEGDGRGGGFGLDCNRAPRGGGGGGPGEREGGVVPGGEEAQGGGGREGREKRVREDFWAGRGEREGIFGAPFGPQKGEGGFI